MKQELDDKLCADFPLLYRDRHGNARSTCMCWGFDVGNGWEPLIRRASEKLERLIELQPEELRKEFAASQVKEKFGTLRLYLNGFTSEMYAVVTAAEKESAVTCEECGAPGTLRGRDRGWLYTACEAHIRKPRDT